MSEMCCMGLAGNTGRKNRHLRNLRTNLSGYIFANKACIDNRKKKLVKQQYLVHMCPQYGISVGEFGAPQQISTGFASWLCYCSEVVHWRPTTLLHDVWPSSGLVH